MLQSHQDAPVRQGGDSAAGVHQCAEDGWVVMVYKANVLQVMIASPGDVTEERNAAREEIIGWNYIGSYEKKLVILPVGWETHSSPELGDRPQAIINKQVLDDCDILIGIFWTRLGTPTDLAASGTVEEI